MLGPTDAQAQAPPEVNSRNDADRLSQSVTDRHGIIASGDGTCLFYRYWPAHEGTSSAPVVVVLHGIGYHSGPYRVIADALNPRGMDVYALDARGHGLSCGRRGYLGSPSEIAKDVSSVVEFARHQQPSAKIYLLGESMGGAYALNYAKDHSHQIAGLILLAPAIAVSPHQLWRLGNLPLLPYLLFARRKLAIDLAGERLEESSRDRTFIASRRTDPLAFKRVGFGYLFDIQHLVRRWKVEIAPTVLVPTLIIQGEKDLIVSQKACQQFVEFQTAKDKQYSRFPGVRHTTLWDPETPKILQFVGDWILKH